MHNCALSDSTAPIPARRCHFGPPSTVTCLQIVGTVLLWIWTLAVGAVFVVLIYACVVNTEKLSAGAFWGLFVLFGVFARSLAAACSATYSVHERLSGRVARADGLTEKSDL